MRVFGLALATTLLSTSLAAAEVKVMASIKPIHSLVATVMAGTGTPGLIVDGSNSPHNFTLRPTDAAALEQAQVIFWVGHELEAFLEKPIEALGSKATAVPLLDAEGIKTLPVREDANFEAEEEEGHEHHDHEGADPHVWLDPENAKAMLKKIADTLSTADPANAEKYKANATDAAGKLDILTSETKLAVASARGKGFIVFHDAYQYFETRFDVKSAGSISVNPENPPGAKKIAALQKRLADNKVSCVFSEPQFDNKLVNVILENTSVKSGVLDPLGSAIEPGPALYEAVVRKLATDLTACLSQVPG